MATRITLEVFPEFELDVVTIEMSYRGATPSEVEEGIVVKIEEAIQDLVGIEKISSEAREGRGTVTVEIKDGYEPRELLDDIKNRVDAISTFPVETERPLFSVAKGRREVINVVVYGDLPERQLRQLGERVRDDLTGLPRITQVDMVGVRPYEISIEVDNVILQEYGLTIGAVANAVRQSSLDLPAGALKTAGGEILLRSKGQAYVKKDFENIAVIHDETGVRLTLGEIAVINDGFEEEPLFSRFNNEPCVMLDVYRVGDQNAIELADSVKEYVNNVRNELPPGVKIETWRDRSKIVAARLNTLLKSASQGGVLVILILAMFLRISVAFWVCVGIPISFAGAIALMPEIGVTVNIVSLFAFILVLGIVVDDAIVTGENIFNHLQKTTDGTRAAIDGTLEVALPVTFGVLTTVIAFLPIAMIGGRLGPIFSQIPLVVIPVLLFSLVESKLILPAHLKHIRIKGEPNPQNVIMRVQQRIADSLVHFVHTVYQPVLSAAMRCRYVTMSIFLGFSICVISLVVAGNIRFVFFPRIESEVARATLLMPIGTPLEITASHIDRIADAADTLRSKYVDEESGQQIIKNILATYGSTGGQRGRSHVGRVTFEIIPPEERRLPVTSSQLVQEWRKEIGSIVGSRELTFRAEIGRQANPIEIRIAGNNFYALNDVAQKTQSYLAGLEGVFDITNDYEEGKQEITLKIKPEAELLGLTMEDLARQVRDGFFGREAQRIQRGRDDVRVMVRYPAAGRQSLGDLEAMHVRTSAGVEVPFSHLAEATVGKSSSTINRVDRRRTINVIADVNKEEADITGINQKIESFMDTIIKEHPGIAYSMEGEAREQRETFAGVLIGLAFVLFIIYALLAIPFKSYIQPLIVMSAIPFGVVGAIIGHMIMGMSLSIFSVFGMLALAGVVVNDSLVMVDYVNRRRLEDMDTTDAVRTAGVARFRAILLTSLTTFAGLMPLIFEKSTQAQFLIPMAVSLGFGILFATFVTLLLVPINYLIMDDIVRSVRKFFTRLYG